MSMSPDQPVKGCPEGMKRPVQKSKRPTSRRDEGSAVNHGRLFIDSHLE